MLVPCWTPALLAPHHYDNSSDIYSYSTLEQHGAGVMLDRLDITSRISPAAVDLLCQMLVVDRELRPLAAEVLAQHEFFTA